MTEQNPVSEKQITVNKINGLLPLSSPQSHITDSKKSTATDTASFMLLLLEDSSVTLI